MWGSEIQEFFPGMKDLVSTQKKQSQQAKVMLLRITSVGFN